MTYLYNLGQKFKQIAAQFAQRTALITEAGEFSYAELDSRSDLIANNLRSFGLQSGDVICISGKKSVLPIAVLLAALKSGITYSMFDPESPLERLSKIFHQCRPKLVLDDGDLVGDIQRAGFKSIPFETIDGGSVTVAAVGGTAQLGKTLASSPAYIMFTSGSTGFPKGAVMTHQNVLNLIEWSIGQYKFTPGDVLTSVNPLFFDNSVFDIYSSLFCGASLALFSAETVRNPGKLMQLINEYRCTSWFSVPSMLIYLQTMRATRPENMRYIKRIIFGGEGYPKAKLKQLFDIYSHRIEFHNVYGPTECTCICSSYGVTEDDFRDLQGFLPLGSLIPNFDYLIVDEELMPVEPGQTGELILRGPNVGLGYYSDQERTQEGFIQNPCNDSYREIVYRTGDLAYFNPDDGRIWIVGRRDNQIKHMGYRIELEEIENALSCIDSVKHSAVVHCEIRGLSQIVAFIKSENGRADETEIRCRLQEIIPQYMVPTRFEFLDVLPKNANGKLDRKRLQLEYAGQHANG